MRKIITSVLLSLALIVQVHAEVYQQKTSATKTQAAPAKKPTPAKPAAPSKKPAAKKPVTTTVKKDTLTKPAEKHFAIYLNRAEFINRIHDVDKDATNFKYKGDKPCIIDFYTTWCGPCRMLTPILEDLAKEYEGKIYIYKVDAEKEKELAALFQVQAYPTLFFVPMNGQLQVAKGALPKAELVNIINNVLLGKQAPPPPPTLLKRQ